MTHETAIEAACRALHEAQGTGDADAPLHSPYQNSWEEPDTVRWKQWIETCEEVISAYLKARSAILCDEKPIAWSNPEHMFLDDRVSTLTASRWRPNEKDHVALYAAIPDTQLKS
ncbi:hypothetical protein [Rhizobium sp. MHM7A]|uniref:hypothetical protein n=1 Tax=Rhizobium sp. MHM7A TaxID=2583233 RepID=UPI001105CF53|nr:hypothetical protein [Rhizobium sp. MHM7A]TLX16047.1 hypothetical protein FFR93_01635 [Rhizobium sp. MHM7A]